MKKYLSKKYALEKYTDITIQELDNIAEIGEVDTVIIASSTEEDENESVIYLHDKDLSSYTARKGIKPEKFSHLKKNLLSVTKASKIYDISRQTIYNWIKQGYLEPIGNFDKQTIISEADIAYLSALAKASNLGPGRKLF